MVESSSGVVTAGPSHEAIDALYDALDEQFQPTLAPAYERLVVPHGSSDEPVHRWFRMKEAYSHLLLKEILNDLDLTDDRGLRIIDPFLGSGTTAVSALMLGLTNAPEVAGIEVNPFLGLLSDVKVRSLGLSSQSRVAIEEQLRADHDRVLRSRRGRAPSAPKLSAFENEAYFAPATMARLTRMRANWMALEEGLSRDLIAIALAATLEPASSLRKDGRALRYEPAKEPEDPEVVFSQRVDEIVADLGSARTNGSGVVIKGSSLDLASWESLPSGDGSWDLCMFSPPYPNNIDYTEVYKMETWFLGLIKDVAQFRTQRQRTLRSHPSIIFAERGPLALPLSANLKAEVDRLNQAIRSAIPDDKYTKQRVRTVRGYLEDCAILMERAFAALRPGGHLVYIVGNSRHGSDHEFTVASDVLLAALGVAAGFDVKAVKIARDLHRRGRHDHLRESVVFLQRPL